MTSINVYITNLVVMKFKMQNCLSLCSLSQLLRLTIANMNHKFSDLARTEMWVKESNFNN